MRLSNPIESLAAALHHAALVALPALTYSTRDFSSPDRAATKQVVRQPQADECAVRAMFPQTWGSTALGFGGIGGQAITQAYTVAIEGPGGDVAVYWQGRFAYLVLASNAEGMASLLADLAVGTTCSRRDATARYGVSA